MAATHWDLWTDEVFETGLRATLIAGTGMLVAAALPGWSGHGLPFALAVLTAGAPAMLLAPSAVRRRLRDHLGAALPVLWSIVIVSAVSLGVAVTGDPTGPVVAAYVLPVVYFSTLYPGRVQLLLLVLLFGSYALVIGTTQEPVAPGPLLVLATVIGTTAYLVNQLSRQLRAHHEREREAQALALRRAALIRQVVRAGEGETLDAGRIIEDLLEAARDLGMECVALFELDLPAGECSVSHGRGFSDDEVGVPRPLDDRLVAAAARSGETIVIDNADRIASDCALVQAHRLASVLAVPIRIGGEAAAVLAAGTRHRPTVGSELLEAFELLALRAENALTRAQRFSQQDEALHRMRELDRMKNDFVATASHELRTPVTVVKAASELLRRHWERLDEDRRRDLFDRLSAHVERLDGVVDSLTRFRKLQLEGYEADLRVVGLREQLLTVIDRIRDERNARIVWHVDQEHEVITDTRLFQAALRELVENAVRHADDPRGCAVSAHGVDDHVIVAVSDHGPGLPDNVTHDLRASFRRGGSATRSQSGGLGLGLATAMTALELLDIEPDVTSGRGAGTTWKLRLVRAPRGVIDLGRTRVSPARDRSQGRG